MNEELLELWTDAVDYWQKACANWQEMYERDLEHDWSPHITGHALNNAMKSLIYAKRRVRELSQAVAA
jgi:hypothetical protein